MNLIPIEDAVIDLDEVADKLQLGPQAELLEKIERQLPIPAGFAGTPVYRGQIII